MRLLDLQLAQVGQVEMSCSLIASTLLPSRCLSLSHWGVQTYLIPRILSYRGSSIWVFSQCKNFMYWAYQYSVKFHKSNSNQLINSVCLSCQRGVAKNRWQLCSSKCLLLRGQLELDPSPDKLERTLLAWKEIGEGCI